MNNINSSMLINPHDSTFNWRCGVCHKANTLWICADKRLYIPDKQRDSSAVELGLLMKRLEGKAYNAVVLIKNFLSPYHLDQSRMITDLLPKLKASLSSEIWLGTKLYKYQFNSNPDIQKRIHVLNDPVFTGMLETMTKYAKASGYGQIPISKLINMVEKGEDRSVKFKNNDDRIKATKHAIKRIRDDDYEKLPSWKKIKKNNVIVIE